VSDGIATAFFFADLILTSAIATLEAEAKALDREGETSKEQAVAIRKAAAILRERRKKLGA
jgi:hypothetical protein